MSQKLGGYDKVCEKKLWKGLYDKLGGNPGNTSAATCTRRHYEKWVPVYASCLNTAQLRAHLLSKNSWNLWLDYPPHHKKYLLSSKFSQLIQSALFCYQYNWKCLLCASGYFFLSKGLGKAKTLINIYQKKKKRKKGDHQMKRKISSVSEYVTKIRQPTINITRQYRPCPSLPPSSSF